MPLRIEVKLTKCPDWIWFQVNTVGTFNVSRLGVELIAQNKPDEDGVRGVIMNTSSSIAFRSCQGQVANAAATGGIDALTQSLAAEFRPLGVRVVAIAPGIFDTPVADFLPEDVQECISDECLLHPKRFGASAEFAHLVQRMTVNPHLNGTTIHMDAGLNMTL